MTLARRLSGSLDHPERWHKQQVICYLIRRDTAIMRKKGLLVYCCRSVTPLKGRVSINKKCVQRWRIYDRRNTTTNYIVWFYSFLKEILFIYRWSKQPSTSRKRNYVPPIPSLVFTINFFLVFCYQNWLWIRFGLWKSSYVKWEIIAFLWWNYT
jgi:hypothetical protein